MYGYDEVSRNTFLENMNIVGFVLKPIFMEQIDLKMKSTIIHACLGTIPALKLHSMKHTNIMSEESTVSDVFMGSLNML